MSKIKRIIEIEEDTLKFVQELTEIIIPARSGKTLQKNVIEAIKFSKPYDDNGDLISREALKKAIDTIKDTGYDTNNEPLFDYVLLPDLIKTIDNAPTVHPRDNYDLGYVQGLEDSKKKENKHFVSFNRTCHICGYSLATYNPEDYKFCPRCGTEF